VDNPGFLTAISARNYYIQSRYLPPYDMLVIFLLLLRSNILFAPWISPCRCVTTIKAKLFKQIYNNLSV
jgi:hypothetical protein